MKSVNRHWKSLRNLFAFYGGVALLTAGAALAWSCSHATAPRSERTFTLTSIGGESLPWTYDDSLDLRVHSGSITLAESTLVDRLAYDYADGGQKITETDSITGRYKVVGSTIEFKDVATGYYAVGNYDGSVIVFLYGQGPWVYRR